MSGCKCDLGLSNTGLPNCVTLQSVTNSLILVPTYDSTGVRNGIDLSAPLPTWTSLYNQADASKRWFPLLNFENVEMPKADSTFDEAPSGRKSFIKTGKRSFSGELWDATPQLLGKIENNRCVEFSLWEIDINGNLVGSKEGTMLYPIPVDNQSFDARLMKATDTTTQKIMISFDFYRLFDESTLWMITPEESNFDFNTQGGLLDVNFEEVSKTSTQVVTKLTLDYGTAVNPILVKGLLAVNFTLFDVTANASVTILTATETPDGVYTITYAAITGYVNNLRLTLVKDGYIGKLEYVDA